MDWDILLNSVSIKEDIAEFQIRIDDSAYVRELTMFSVDPDFFDSLDYTTLPTLSVEVKTKLTDTWVSQGEFYIESNTYALTSSSKVSRGVWGRSTTAKAGTPFAGKVTKTWEDDTTIQAIITEMADLVGLGVLFEIDDYNVYGGTYSAELRYPIEIIDELAKFAGAFVSCDTSGNLVIKKRIYHTTSYDYEVTNDDIRELTEKVVYPDFGNRIRVGSFGSNTGYSVTVKQFQESLCLPADEESRLTLLAFVTLDGEPAENNLLVDWEAEAGITLDYTESPTQQFFLNKQVHKASSYRTIEVDFPIYDVIGIWAYSDTQLERNYWDESLSGNSFSDNEITLNDSLQFCDQTVLVSYITSGVSVNYATAGARIATSTVTASLEGSEGVLDVIVGNICECGTDLWLKKIPDTDICLGNEGYVLAYAEVSGAPGTGLVIQFENDGCGALSSTKKTLGQFSILNEKATVYNVISGTTQVDSEITIVSETTPEVYLVSDTTKSNDLYSSNTAKTIDLNTVLENGTEVYIDYLADGAAAVTWYTDSTTDTDDCEGEVTAYLADGTEEGIETSVTYSTQNCSPEDDDDDDSDWYSESDPDDIDYSTSSGGNSSTASEGGLPDPEGDSGVGGLDACGINSLNIWANIYDATQENFDSVRFGIGPPNECPEDGEHPCSCEELCSREVANRGNTWESDIPLTVLAQEYGETGSPEYNEAYNTLMADALATCEETCEETRENGCDCEVQTTDLILDPGESMEVVCSDGVTGTITMPEDACGTQTFTVGCCTFEVLSTSGEWEVEVVGTLVSANQPWCSIGENENGTEYHYWAGCWDEIYEVNCGSLGFEGGLPPCGTFECSNPNDDVCHYLSEKRYWVCSS